MAHQGGVGASLGGAPGGLADAPRLWSQQDLASQQGAVPPDAWMRMSLGEQLPSAGQLRSASAASDGDTAAGGGGLSVGDPLSSATLLIRPGVGPKTAVLAAQGQPAGVAPGDAAALLRAQRRALMLQQVAAASAQQQQQQLMMQAQQGGAVQQQQQQAGDPAAHAAQGAALRQQGSMQPPHHPTVQQLQQLQRLQQQVQAQQAQQAQQAPEVQGPALEVDSDLLDKEGERVVSALSGGRAERAWALNALCLLSFRQDVHLSSTPGLLAALLPVVQEGLAAAVGLSSEDASGGPCPDEARAQQGLPPLPGWQRRRAERACRWLFPDHSRLEERLQEAAAAAVVLRNVAEVQQNAVLLLDPPVMRCWTWAIDAARELVQQQVCSGDGGGASVAVASSCTSADICTTLLQMVTVLSQRMLLPAFFECGMLLLRSLLLLLRPSWQYSAAAAGGAVLPPPLVSLATLALTAVATAYQPNTDILLSMTGAPGGGQPGATLMQVVADLLVCPFEVFRQHTQQQVDEESPGWRLLLPTHAELIVEVLREREARKNSARGAGGGASLAGVGAALALDMVGGTAHDRSTAALCALDMLAVLSQLRYLSALLHLLWRLLTATGPAGAHARAAVAGCPRLLSTLCEIAVHRWPPHPLRWHADGHAVRHPDTYQAYLRFLSVNMMPAMRERQELLQPLRADAAALLALLAADPETRQSVAWCEGHLVATVMAGTVPPTEPGVSALLARFAAQGGGPAGGSGAAGATATPPQPFAAHQA